MGKSKQKKHKKDKIKKKSISSDFKGIIYITIGLIFAIAVYTDLGGILSGFSKILIYRLIGVGIFLIPIVILYMGFSIIYNDGLVPLTRRNLGTSISTIIFLIFISTVKIQSLNINEFYESLRAILTETNFSLHGGFIGHAISYPLSKLLGFAGSYVLYFSILSLTLMMAFDIKIKELSLIYLEIRKSLKEKSRAKAKRLDVKVSDKVVIKNKKANRVEKININSNATDYVDNNDIATNKYNKIEIVNFVIDPEIESIVNGEKNNPKVFDKKFEIETIETKASSDVLNKEIEMETDNDYIHGNINIESNMYTKKEVVAISNCVDVEKEYIFPKTDLLKNNGKSKLGKEDKNELLKSANKLEGTLNSFGVDAKVIKVTKGPSVTRFELQPSPGVKVSKVVNLQDDIALSLAAGGIRMEAPIPGKAAIGIEVPNKKQTPVFLKEVLDSNEFNNSNKKLTFALGKDIGGECVVGDLSKMPHMLIAGATGSGKSVCVNSLIVSLIYKYSPKDVKLLMVDPKVVELSVYNDIPHLLIPVVTDPKKAAGALNWAVNEMNRRYNLFSSSKVKNIESYNSLFKKGIIDEKLPYIVIIVDELADLMMACPGDVEDYICRLAQMARAAGMHLIIATQRPSVDVITGVIKANIPSRISFAVSSGIDSRTIIDQYGAEKLLGRGDMLYYPMGANKPLRVQGAFISEEEVESVVEFVKSDHEPADYEEAILNHINGSAINNHKEEEEDELLEEAINLVVEYNQASTSFLQRKLKVGFNRASRIMETLEYRGIISAKDGGKPRQVLIEKENINNSN